MKGKQKENTNRYERYEEPQRESSYIGRLKYETGLNFTGPEPLAQMKYEDELISKDRAFSTYWYEVSGSCASSAVIASPLPRRYRTTTKRRVHKRSGGVILSSDESSGRDTPSLLEPEFHASVYSMLGSIMNEDMNRRIAGYLNFVIVRGNYESAAVIFNVTVMNGETVRGYTKIAERLRDNIQEINAAFLYHDPEGSKYYLSTSNDVDGQRIKRLFGNRNLSVKVNDIIYTFTPEGFSQVNLSICGTMLDTAGMLLSHEGRGSLVDLYCGYGFFSCFLADKYEEVTGVDYGETAIDSARENMKRLKPRSRWNYFAKKIEKRTLPGMLPEARDSEYFILDPPRNGTAPGVIDFIAERSPESVLHIFCGLDTIPYELDKWERGGYRPVKCVPLDMFPGTPELEVMVLFRRFRSVNRKPAASNRR